MGDLADFQSRMSTVMDQHMALDDLDRRRTARYRDAWRLYLGHHWPMPAGAGEAQLTINYARVVVDLLYFYMYGRMPRISRPTRTGESSEQLATIHEFLKDVWTIHNFGDLTLMDLAVQAGTTGDGYLSVSCIDRDRVTGRELPVEERRICFEVLDPELTFPTHRHSPFGELEQVVIYRPWIHFPWRELKVNDPNVDKTVYEIHVFKEVIRDDRIHEYVDGVEITKPTDIFGEHFEGSRTNPLGRINVVHMRNCGLPREFFGRSDITDQGPLNRVLNGQMSEISDILSYHAAPVTIVKGARASGLERGKNKVWGGVPADGDVFNLEMASDLSGSHKLWAELRQAMLEVSRIPEVATGRALAISNISSAALSLLYGPIREACGRKMPTHRKALTQINDLILRIAELKFDLKLGVKGLARYHTEVMHQVGLPRNRVEDLQVFQQEAVLKLNSRARYWRENGIENTEELATEIAQELKDGILPTETMNPMGNKKPPMSGNDTKGADNPVAGPGRPSSGKSDT